MEYLQYSPFFLTKGTYLWTSTGWKVDQTLYVWQIYLQIHIYRYIWQSGHLFILETRPEREHNRAHSSESLTERTCQRQTDTWTDLENAQPSEVFPDCHLGTCWLPCRSAFLVPVSTKPWAWAAHPLQSFRVPATDGEHKGGQQRLRICLRRATRRDRARDTGGHCDLHQVWAPPGERAMRPGTAGQLHPLPSGQDCPVPRPEVQAAAACGAAVSSVTPAALLHHSSRVVSLRGLQWGSFSCFPEAHQATALPQEPHTPCPLKGQCDFKFLIWHED